LFVFVGKLVFQLKQTKGNKQMIVKIRIVSSTDPFVNQRIERWRKDGLFLEFSSHKRLNIALDVLRGGQPAKFALVVEMFDNDGMSVEGRWAWFEFHANDADGTALDHANREAGFWASLSSETHKEFLWERQEYAMKVANLMNLVYEVYPG